MTQRRLISSAGMQEVPQICDDSIFEDGVDIYWVVIGPIRKVFDPC